MIQEESPSSCSPQGRQLLEQAHISGWKSKCNYSTQCSINAHFLIFFFFFGLFHFPSSLYSKGDRRSWENISIGRGKSELLQWPDCLPFFQRQMPSSVVCLPERIWTFQSFMKQRTYSLSAVRHHPIPCNSWHHKQALLLRVLQLCRALL